MNLSFEKVGREYVISETNGDEVKEVGRVRSVRHARLFVASSRLLLIAKCVAALSVKAKWPPSPFLHQLSLVLKDVEGRE